MSDQKRPFTMADFAENWNLHEEVERLRAINAELLEALQAINRIASPNGNRTFEMAIQDLDAVIDVARAAIAKITRQS